MRRRGSHSPRARWRVTVLTGVTLLALAGAEAPGSGSDAAERQPATTRTSARSAGHGSWHAARQDALPTGARATTARAAEWRAAVSPSPHLSRAQIDAMTPAQIVRATLGNVVRPAVRPRGGALDRRGGRLSFGLTTFNALGSQHTAPGGDAVSYAPGRIRTQWMTDYLAALGSSVVGMQEIQTDQIENLNLTTGGRYSFWPGAALGGGGVPQTMMWQTALWKPKKLDYIVVPFMGGTRPQPVVLLKNRKTKRKIFVLNIHNSPKDAKGRQGERNRAVAIEKRTVRKLRSSGYPVFIVGDFNEHAPAFCGMTDRTSLKAANGGSHPRKGGCHPPKAMRVDWIFGSRQASFANLRTDQGPLVQRITDHAVISTKVTVR